MPKYNVALVLTRRNAYNSGPAQSMSYSEYEVIS
jgi:hypothetical protein